MSFRELVGFLQSPQPEVSRIALESLLPATLSSAGQAFIFKENDQQGARALKKISTQSNDPWTIQNALIALTNLTDNKEIRSDLASDARAVMAYAKIAASTPKTGYTKYACMLLSNLAREPDTLLALKGALLMALVLTTSKPDHLEDSDYDYLVFAFSEFARQDASSIAKLLPYLYGQLACASLIRRKGAAATIKNALFDASLHEPLALDTPLIETIMICLKGPEPLDAEDLEKLPPAVRKEVSDSKQRETDVEQQITLIECLLLLSSSQAGRESLRFKNAYFVVRELHKATNEPRLCELCVNYVNMVLRGDPENDDGPKIQEIKEDEDDEDDVVEEVV